MVAQGLEEPPAKKCTCRKFIPYRKADELVKNGVAAWAVVKRERGTQEVTCPLCSGNPEVKNCAQCGGSGKIIKAVVWDTYNYDIVFVSEASVDPKEKKYRPALALKTPRVATIEEEHIFRAYVEDLREAAERIEEYGYLIQWNLQERGAEMRDRETGEQFFPGIPEPENTVVSYPPGSITFKDGSTNKSWHWTVEGRNRDWGRAI